MRKLTNIQDPVFNSDKELTWADRFFLKFIRDRRDLPFIYLCAQCILILYTTTTLIYTLDGWGWWVAVVAHWVAVLGFLLGPFTLMLHNTSHRPFFKKEYQAGNHIIPWFIGPLMGQSPGLYFAHHIGMHHAENNLPYDRSTTMPFQRDSFADFMYYYGRFILIGIKDVLDYFTFRKRKALWRKSITGELLYWALWAVLCIFVNWQATLAVFILPTIAVRLGMMSGNWSQHAFIDPDAPENSYKNSITCINSRYNRLCFNDGYHIGHHLYPNMHWTDMPGEFLKNQDKYIENNCVVFEGIDYHQIWVFLMFKRYDKLAAHFVNLGNRFASDEEIITFLKARTRKFSQEELKVAEAIQLR